MVDPGCHAFELLQGTGRGAEAGHTGGPRAEPAAAEVYPRGYRGVPPRRRGRRGRREVRARAAPTKRAAGVPEPRQTARARWFRFTGTSGRRAARVDGTGRRFVPSPARQAPARRPRSRSGPRSTGPVPGGSSCTPGMHRVYTAGHAKSQRLFGTKCTVEKAQCSAIAEGDVVGARSSREKAEEISRSLGLGQRFERIERITRRLFVRVVRDARKGCRIARTFRPGEEKKVTAESRCARAQRPYGRARAERTSAVEKTKCPWLLHRRGGHLFFLSRPLALIRICCPTGTPRDRACSWPRETDKSPRGTTGGPNKEQSAPGTTLGPTTTGRRSGRTVPRGRCSLVSERRGFGFCRVRVLVRLWAHGSSRGSPSLRGCRTSGFRPGVGGWALASEASGNLRSTWSVGQPAAFDGGSCSERGECTSCVLLELLRTNIMTLTP